MKIYNGEEIVEKGLIKKVDIKDLREEVEDEGDDWYLHPVYYESY